MRDHPDKGMDRDAAKKIPHPNKKLVRLLEENPEIIPELYTAYVLGLEEGLSQTKGN